MDTAKTDTTKFYGINDCDTTGLLKKIHVKKEGGIDVNPEYYFFYYNNRKQVQTIITHGVIYPNTSARQYIDSTEFTYDNNGYAVNSITYAMSIGRMSNGSEYNFVENNKVISKRYSSIDYSATQNNFSFLASNVDTLFPYTNYTKSNNIAIAPIYVTHNNLSTKVNYYQFENQGTIKKLIEIEIEHIDKQDVLGINFFPNNMVFMSSNMSFYSATPGVKSNYMPICTDFGLSHIRYPQNLTGYSLNISDKLIKSIKVPIYYYISSTNTWDLYSAFECKYNYEFDSQQRLSKMNITVDNGWGHISNETYEYYYYQ